MTAKGKQELLHVYKEQYQGASLKERTRILNVFTEASGLSRKHAVFLLNRDETPTKTGRGRRAKFTKEAVRLLVEAWRLSNKLCSKRLVSFLPEILVEMEKDKVFEAILSARGQLLGISARSIDRLLRPERMKDNRSPSTTKRSSLLKSKVPVRTFTEWNSVKPGFFEIDTVSHSSSNPAGPFVSTLNMTDIATCWTEPVAIPRKGATEVISALQQAKSLLPFPLLGLDSDNGSEFLNQDMLDWVERNKVTYTRSREYKKNDQAWIEEKNRSVVRKNVGRDRLEGDEAWVLLTKYYSVLRLYINFFQPCQKLVRKTRNGAHTYKKHDVAKTPYQRVLENEYVSVEDKLRLRSLRETLSMTALHKTLDELRKDLAAVAVDAPNPIVAILAAQRMATFQFVEQPNTQMESASSSPRNNITPPPALSSESGKGLLLRESIAALPEGALVRAKDFPDFDRNYIDNLLYRTQKSGMLEKVGWGLYRVPARSVGKGNTGHPQTRSALVR